MNNVKYYTVEIIDASFGNDYTAADGIVYPARTTDWGFVAVTSNDGIAFDKVFFFQHSAWKHSKVQKMFDISEVNKFLKITGQLPADADNMRMFCREFGEKFVEVAGTIEKQYWEVFKGALQ